MACVHMCDEGVGWRRLERPCSCLRRSVRVADVDRRQFGSLPLVLEVDDLVLKVLDLG